MNYFYGTACLLWLFWGEGIRRAQSLLQAAQSCSPTQPLPLQKLTKSDLTYSCVHTSVSGCMHLPRHVHICENTHTCVHRHVCRSKLISRKKRYSVRAGPTLNTFTQCFYTPRENWLQTQSKGMKGQSPNSTRRKGTLLSLSMSQQLESQRVCPWCFTWF